MDKKLFIAGLLIPFAFYFLFIRSNNEIENKKTPKNTREYSSVENTKPIPPALDSKLENHDEIIKEIDPKINIKAINDHAKNILEDKISRDDTYDFNDSDKERILLQVIHFVDLTHISYQDIEATVVALMNDQLHEVNDRQEDYGFDLEESEDAE